MKVDDDIDGIEYYGSGTPVAKLTSTAPVMFLFIQKNTSLT